MEGNYESSRRIRSKFISLEEHLCEPIYAGGYYGVHSEGEGSTHDSCMSMMEKGWQQSGGPKRLTKF